MTRNEQDTAARRRAFSLRLSAAIDAQRRLDALRVHDGQFRTDPIDPRHIHLTRAHD